MNIIKNRKKSKNVEGLEVIELDTFKDFRGEIWTVYSEEYSDLKFVADKITVSTFGVLRGFHGDKHTAKLITCLSGQMQFAVVDLQYKGPEGQVTISWDDPDINVKWTIQNPILSERDKKGVSYKGIYL